MAEEGKEPGEHRGKGEEWSPDTGGRPPGLEISKEWKGKVRERAGGGRRGGGANPSSSFQTIEKWIATEMALIEAENRAPTHDDSRVEAIRELLTEAERHQLETQRATEHKEMAGLRQAVEAKLGLLEFYHDAWRGGKLGEGGAAAGVRKILEHVKIIDDKQVLRTLMADEAIAGEFGELINTHDDPHPTIRDLKKRQDMGGWNGMAQKLEEDRQKWNQGADVVGSMKKTSAERYGYMLYDILGLAAEADDPSLPKDFKHPGREAAYHPRFWDQKENLVLKYHPNVTGGLAWEQVGGRLPQELFHYWRWPAAVFKPSDFDPLDPDQVIDMTDVAAVQAGLAALKEDDKKKPISNSTSTKTGLPANHGDILYLGNFIAWPKMWDWTKVPEEVRRQIHSNQVALSGVDGREVVHYDDPNFHPRGVAELKKIDWTKIDFKQGEALRLASPYTAWCQEKGKGEDTLEDWFLKTVLDAVQASKTEGKPVNLDQIMQPFWSNESHFYKTWISTDRMRAEVRAMQSTLLWLYEIPYYQSYMWRDKAQAGALGQLGMIGGDAERSFQLYGRDFDQRSLNESPITPSQAAFMLLRIYGRTAELKTNSGRATNTRDLLNKAVTSKESELGSNLVEDSLGKGKRKWQDAARADGRGRQTFVEFLEEIDRDRREETDLSGLTGKALDWSLAARERSEVIAEAQRTGNHRLLYLMEVFSASSLAIFQWRFFEEVVKNGVGYHAADEEKIFNAHNRFEQFYGQTLMHLRDFTPGGDRFLEYAAGRLVVGGEVENYLDNYTPFWEENKTGNAALWLFPLVTRQIEHLMVHLSRGFSTRFTAYHSDPETKESLTHNLDLAVASPEDRYLLLQLIFEQDDNARSVFGSEGIRNLQERFHCTGLRAEVHKRMRKAFLIEDPVGYKQEDPEAAGEKRKSTLQKFLPGFLQQVFDISPLPIRSWADALMAPGLNLMVRAGFLWMNAFAANAGWGLNLSLSEFLRFPQNPIFGLNLAFFGLNLAWITTMVLQRKAVFPAIRWILARRAFEKLWFGVRKTRVNLGLRYQYVKDIV